MVLGDDVSTLETFVWILNHVSRSITWFLFAQKSMKFGQMANLNMIFHMVGGSVYRLVYIRNSPQFPVEFRNRLFLQFRNCRIFSLLLYLLNRVSAS